MVLFGFRIIYRIISIAVAAALVYLVITGVQVETASRMTRLPNAVAHARAIVVTGTPGSPHMSADFRAKLGVARSLYQKGDAPLLVVGLPSGVNRAGGYSATWTKELASAVTPGDVTAVLAKNVGKELSLLEKRIGRGHRVIVVTDAINALYVEGVASGDGMKPEVVAPATSKKILFSQFSQLFREASGVAVGRVIGFSNATWASR